MPANLPTPTPPKQERFTDLERLDRTELDDDQAPFSEEEPDTLRSPIPSWLDWAEGEEESGVNRSRKSDARRSA